MKNNNGFSKTKQTNQPNSFIIVGRDLTGGGRLEGGCAEDQKTELLGPFLAEIRCDHHTGAPGSFHVITLFHGAMRNKCQEDVE